MAAAESLQDKGLAVDDEDDRTVADLLVEQVRAYTLPLHLPLMHAWTHQALSSVGTCASLQVPTNSAALPSRTS
jgi:hypothetical protein